MPSWVTNYAIALKAASTIEQLIFPMAAIKKYSGKTYGKPLDHRFFRAI